MPATPPVEQLPPEERDRVLETLQIRHFDQDILRMDLKELRKHFGYRTTGHIRKEVFFRNVIWQLFEKLQAGESLEFVKKHGFIRGMWYHIKTPITRYRALRGRFYGTMIQVLADMVRWKLINYRDFNFRDKDAPLTLIGTENPHILVFAEKDGQISMLEEINDTYGCTVITLGGSPSLMSCSYLVDGLRAQDIDLDQEFHCFSLVDFDPDGEDTAHDFICNLILFGITRFHPFQQYGGTYRRLDLLQPQTLGEADIENSRYTLPTVVQRSAQCLKWARRTGGVNGRGSREYGLESDEFSYDRIHELVDVALTPFLRTPAVVVQKRRRMHELRKSLGNFILAKLTRPTPPTPGPSQAGAPSPARSAKAALSARRTRQGVPEVAWAEPGCEQDRGKRKGFRP